MADKEYLGPDYQWTDKLEIGDKFTVVDNSYCYALNPDGSRNTEEDVLLAPGTCYDEHPYCLFIEKFSIEKFPFFGGEHVMKAVQLKSSITGKRYLVGICWNERVAKLHGNI